MYRNMLCKVALIVILSVVYVNSGKASTSITDILGDSGISIVNDVIPELVSAVEEVFPNDDMQKLFFKDWTLMDVQLFVMNFKQYFAGINKDALLSPEEHENALAMGLPSVFVEIFGAIYLRNMSRDIDDAYFVNEIFLDYVINHGDPNSDTKIFSSMLDQAIPLNRHDGAVISIVGDKLVIHKVFEAKLGGKFEIKQSEGVLKRWQKHGVYVGKRLFKPNSVYVMSGNRAIPIYKIRTEKFLESTYVVGAVPTITGESRVYLADYRKVSLHGKPGVSTYKILMEISRVFISKILESYKALSKEVVSKKIESSIMTRYFYKLIAFVSKNHRLPTVDHKRTNKSDWELELFARLFTKEEMFSYLNDYQKALYESHITPLVGEDVNFFDATQTQQMKKYVSETPEAIKCMLKILPTVNN